MESRHQSFPERPQENPPGVGDTTPRNPVRSWSSEPEIKEHISAAGAVSAELVPCLWELLKGTGIVPVGLIQSHPDPAAPHWGYGDIGKYSHNFFPHPGWAVASVSKACRQWGCPSWPVFWWQFHLSDKDKPEPASCFCAVVLWGVRLQSE